MGVNISGKGVLSGLASLVTGVVNNFNLLITRLIGYTSVSGGGSTYYTTTVGSISPGYMAAHYSGGLSSSYSLDGLTWQTGQDQKQSAIDGAAYGNGVFVISGGYASKIAYSSDGVSWNLANAAAAYGGFYRPVYGNGVFVAIPYWDEPKNPSYSTDGATWTMSSADLGNYSGPNDQNIYFLNNTFVYWAQNGKISYSTDGITWSFSQLPELLNTVDLAYGNGKFVAVGLLGETAYSSDLTSWTSGEPTMSSSRMEYGSGKFVTINESGRTSYSSDGINWTESGYVYGSATGSTRSFVYGNGVFVALTARPDGFSDVSYSSDGINWTVSNLSTSTFLLKAQYVNNKFFVSAAPFEGELWESEDGINWTLVAAVPGNSWGAIAYGNISTLTEVQISIGNQGEEGAEILAPVDVYTVPAGKTTDIDEVTVKNNSANTITYDLAVLDAGIELTDLNALVNDQAVSAGATATVSSISQTLTPGQRIVAFPSAVDVVEVKVYGNETAIPVLVAVGQGFDGNSKEFGYTYDGESWTLLDGVASRYKDVVYANNKFVAAGNGYMAYSTDGISWVETVAPREYNKLTYGNGKFAAISEWDGYNSYILTSSDGISWSEGTLSGEVQSIAFGNGTFVLSSYYQFATSSNAVDWTYANYPSTEYSIVINKLKFINNKFVGVGASGGLAISTDGINWTIDSTKAANDVEYLNGKYYAPGSNQFWSSTDGITWSAANSGGTAFEGRSIAYGDGKFVVVGNGKIGYSTDGASWTIDNYNSKAFMGVKFFNNKFIVIGSDNMTMSGLTGYSQDGQTWNIVPSNLSSYNGAMANI